MTSLLTHPVGVSKGPWEREETVAGFSGLGTDLIETSSRYVDIVIQWLYYRMVRAILIFPHSKIYSVLVYFLINHVQYIPH